MMQALKDLLEVSSDEMQQLRGRAQFFLDGGHWERALIMLDMLEALDAVDVVPTLLAAEALLQLGRSLDAEQRVDAVLARDPARLDALVLKAKCLLARADLAAATAVLRDVLRRAPSSQAAACARSVARSVLQRRG